MKTKIYLFLFVIFVLSCQKKEPLKTLLPREISANETFNEFPKEDGKFNIYTYDQKNTSAPEGGFIVKYRDTTVQIQTSADDKNSVVNRFASAQFINTQKTSLLVQLIDNSGLDLVAPFYLITLKDRKIQAISLFRPSKGKNDQEFTQGLTKSGRSGYVINNDFFITSVDARVYLLKRQHPEERIQGMYFSNSPDRNTLVFLTGPSLYQVHYTTGDTFTQPLPSKVPKDPTQLAAWIQKNYSWQKNDKSVFFLKPDSDNDRVVDISEFK